MAETATDSYEVALRGGTLAPAAELDEFIRTTINEALRIYRGRIVEALLKEALGHKIHEAHNVHDALCDFADRLESSDG